MSGHAVKSELFYHKIPKRLYKRQGGGYKLYSLLKNSSTDEFNRL